MQSGTPPLTPELKLRPADVVGGENADSRVEASAIVSTDANQSRLKDEQMSAVLQEQLKAQRHDGLMEAEPDAEIEAENVRIGSVSSVPLHRTALDSRFDALVSRIQPIPSAERTRSAIYQYACELVKRAHSNAVVFCFGSFPLKTYCPVFYCSFLFISFYADFYCVGFASLILVSDVSMRMN